MSEFAALNSRDSFTFRWNQNPVCPRCAHECRIDDEEWYHLYEEGEQDVECPSCDGKFIVFTHVAYTFSTDEQEAA